MNEWVIWWELQLLAIGGLTAVLIAKEIVRAYRWPGSSHWFKALNFAIMALTPIVLAIFAFRFVYIASFR